jgi:hypothetical protein
MELVQARIGDVAVDHGFVSLRIKRVLIIFTSLSCLLKLFAIFVQKIQNVYII